MSKSNSSPELSEVAKVDKCDIPWILTMPSKINIALQKIFVDADFIFWAYMATTENID